MPLLLAAPALYIPRAKGDLTYEVMELKRVKQAAEESFDAERVIPA